MTDRDFRRISEETILVRRNHIGYDSEQAVKTTDHYTHGHTNDYRQLHMPALRSQMAHWSSQAAAVTASKQTHNLTRRHMNDRFPNKAICGWLH